MDKQRVKFVGETKADKKDRTLTVTISTKTPDRSRDVVMPYGMKTDNYMRNPVVAFGHDYRGLAIARTKSLAVADDRIVAEVEFPEEGIYPFADQVYRLYQKGFMNAWSIGFIPMKALDLETGGRQFDEWELLEFSAVLVPDNPEALTMLRSSKSFKAEEMKDFTDVLESKAVIPYKDLGTAGENAEWDGSAEVSAATVEDLKLMSTWYDAENPDVKSSYKLPHHKASGGNPAVLRGVYAAMGAVLGARGGVEIPDSDKRGVYNHLARHYAQYDVEPPEFKKYELLEINDLFKEFEKEIDALILSQKDVTSDPAGDEDTDPEKKEGRVLSAKTRKQIGEALAKIDGALEAFSSISKSLNELLVMSDTPDSEPDKSVVDLKTALKTIDKVVGLALRDAKNQ